MPLLLQYLCLKDSDVLVVCLLLELQYRQFMTMLPWDFSLDLEGLPPC